MAIDKRKRHRGFIYRVRILVDGKRVSKSFTRKIDAIKFEQQAQLDSSIVDGFKLSFKQAALDWLNNHARPRKAPGTVKNNERMINKDLIQCFGEMKLAKIQSGHIDSFIASLNGKMSNASINDRLELIRAICNYYIKRRALSYSPMSAVDFLKVDPKAMKFWSLAEARCFLEHARSKYFGTSKEAIYFYYLISLNTGMRVGEVLALKWAAIDFESRLIMVCRSKCHHTHEVRETTKGRRIRHVPMNDVLYEELRDLKTKSQGSEWVLHTKDCMLDHCNITNRHWNQDIKDSGVSRIRIHDMRHTYASHFMQQGGDLFKLQAILGHADMRTTMQYSHFSKSFLQENANIVQFGTGDNLVKVDFAKTGTNTL